jgi:hypothetical protein
VPVASAEPDREVGRDVDGRQDLRLQAEAGPVREDVRVWSEVRAQAVLIGIHQEAERDDATSPDSVSIEPMRSCASTPMRSMCQCAWLLMTFPAAGTMSPKGQMVLPMSSGRQRIPCPGAVSPQKP